MTGPPESSNSAAPLDPEERYRRLLCWERTTWGTHCSNCLSTCSYKVYSASGRVLWEEPAADFDPIEEGVPDQNPMGCQKGAAWFVQLSTADRLLYPMKRVGKRGEGRFVRISWDEALDEVADAILDAIEESGPEAVLVDEGPEGGMLTIMGYLRFANVLGAVSLDGNATVNDFPAGHYITFGTMAGGSEAADTFHSELILIWHSNPAYTRIPYFHYLTEARYKGAEVVLIAPDFSPSAPHCDYFIPVMPGTDAALALSMAYVIVTEGLVDEEFVTSQTDLCLLVRRDNGKLLRECDVVEGGRDNRFYVWKPDTGLVAAPHDILEYGFTPALRGDFEIEALGSNIEVAPVFELLVERLARYKPEASASTCGVNPAVIRMLARKIASSKTKLCEGFDTAKHYNGDLVERSIDLVLALTGNWGRKGRGYDTFCSFPLDGGFLLELKERTGVEAAVEILEGIRRLIPPPQIDGDGRYRYDTSAARTMGQVTALAGSTTPPFFFWLNHCGYGEIWNRSDWGHSPRPISDYIDEATPMWSPLIRPRPDQTPRVLIEAGTNALRRTRGGQRMLLRHLWPKLKMIVSVDTRINTAGLYADILLPAAQEAERVNIQYPISHSIELAFSDRAVPPAGEAKSDWQIFAALAERVAGLAESRGMGDWMVGRVKPRRLSDLGRAFSLEGSLCEDEDVVEELVRDTALAGSIEESASLGSLRKTGRARVVGNGSFPSGILIGSPIRPGETLSGFRFHVENRIPYATLTGRATFYVDHPWFIEAGEELPCHKDPPRHGGDHPFVLTGGHPRWSIHACNATNPLLLETTRGHPTVVMNSDVASGKGIADGDEVEIFNDLGSFRVHARLSPAVRPGQLILYASWEPYGFESWRDATEVESGMVKWLHLATGWGHLHYLPFQWQPAPFDRLTRVSIRPISERNHNRR